MHHVAILIALVVITAYAETATPDVPHAGATWLHQAPPVGGWRFVQAWATWCGPCHQIAPQLDLLAGLAPITVISITSEPMEKVRGDASASSWQHHVGSDAVGYRSVLDGASSIPYAAIIAPDGTIILRSHPAQILDVAYGLATGRLPIADAPRAHDAVRRMQSSMQSAAKTRDLAPVIQAIKSVSTIMPWSGMDIHLRLAMAADQPNLTAYTDLQQRIQAIPPGTCSPTMIQFAIPALRQQALPWQFREATATWLDTAVAQMRNKTTPSSMLQLLAEHHLQHGRIGDATSIVGSMDSPDKDIWTAHLAAQALTAP